MRRGTCKSDSRYPHKLEQGVIFIPFPKPGHTRDFVRPGVPMTELNKKAEAEKTKKAKRWLHLCGRKHFNSLDQIKNHTYVCSLHFRSRSGPTKEDPDPILATLTDEQQETRLKRKRKAPKDRSEQIKHRKVLRHSSTSGTDTASEFEQTETVHSPVAENIPEDLHSHKNEMGTQTEHDNWQVRARLDTIIMRNQLITATNTGTDGNVNAKMDMLSPDQVLSDDKRSKFFLGLYPGQFVTLYTFLGPAKYKLDYWRGEKQKENKRKTESSMDNRHFTPKEELFITLLKLRRGFTHQTLAYLYDVSVYCQALRMSIETVTSDLNCYNNAPFTLIIRRTRAH